MHGSWEQSINAFGSGSHDIVLANSRYMPSQWRDATAHWWMSLVEYHDGVPKYWGVIKDKRWIPDRRTLHLDTVTPEALLQDRYILGVGNLQAGEDMEYAFKVVSKSLRAAMAQAIMWGIGQAGAPLGWDWGLPFRFSNVGESGSFSHSWPFHDWKTIWDIVRYIQSLENGADLAFVPALNGGNIVADVLIGNPRISGPTIDLPMSVRKSRVSGLIINEIGSDMLTGAFGKPEGYGADVGEALGLAGTPSDVTRTMPVRDAVVGVEDEDTNVQSFTTEYQKQHAAAVRQDEFTLHVEDDASAYPFPVADLRLGTRLNARRSGDEYRDPETNTYYVTKLSYDASSRNVYRPEVLIL